MVPELISHDYFSGISLCGLKRTATRACVTTSLASKREFNSVATPLGASAIAHIAVSEVLPKNRTADMSDEAAAGLKRSMSPGLFEKYCPKLVAAVSPEKMARPDFDAPVPASAEKPQKTNNPLSTTHRLSKPGESTRATPPTSEGEAEPQKQTEKIPETQTNETDTTQKERQLTKITQQLMKENEKLRETQRKMAEKVNELALLVQEQKNTIDTAMAGWQQMLLQEVSDVREEIKAEYEGRISAMETKMLANETKYSDPSKEQQPEEKDSAGWDFAHHQEPLEPLDALTYAYQIDNRVSAGRKGVHDIPTLASYLHTKIPSLSKILDSADEYESKVERIMATISAALPKSTKEVHTLTTMQILRDYDSRDIKYEIDIAIYNALKMQPKQLISAIQKTREGEELAHICESSVDITSLPGVDMITAQSALGSTSHLKLMLDLITALVGQDDLADSSTIEERIRDIDSDEKPRVQVHKYNLLYSQLKKLYGGTDPWGPEKKVSALIDMHAKPKELRSLYYESLRQDGKDWQKMPWAALQSHYISTAKN